MALFANTRHEIVECARRFKDICESFSKFRKQLDWRAMWSFTGCQTPPRKLFAHFRAENHGVVTFVRAFLLVFVHDHRISSVVSVISIGLFEDPPTQHTCVSGIRTTQSVGNIDGCAIDERKGKSVTHLAVYSIERITMWRRRHKTNWFHGNWSRYAIISWDEENWRKRKQEFQWIANVNMHKWKESR